jgi:hypothetical protein
MLSTELKCPWIDGDVVRKLVGNNDYSELGRRENIDLIQEMAVVSHRHNKWDLPTPPNHKTAHHVTYYEPPVQYFLEVNTFLFTPDVCLAKIMDSLTPIHA